MSNKNIYRSIISGEQLYHEEIAPGNRIAISLPGGRLDIMKIASIGNNRTGYDTNMHMMVVAKVCPGQYSVTMHPDENVSLNTPIATDKGPLAGDRGVPKNYKNAHWREMISYPVYRINKSTMKKLCLLRPI